MATSLSAYLAQWLQREDQYRDRHRTDEEFARTEMTQAGLSPEHQDLLFSKDRDAIRAQLRHEGKTDDEVEEYETYPDPWGY